ncbi:porin [Paraburkholderia phytofirmans]|uniref:porin n=1 Tax=Paraburkholderia sp. BL9I2N2 TaxID=1938809 RepID=UPI001051B6D4|nr:porin [Paraburkholderia sp. BL9I2N2]TCK88562.1 putative porin [Paraburkholderia sp. BL9I2N2]
MRKLVTMFKISFATSLILASGSALAQSSVTLYGIVEDGFIYSNNQKGGAVIQATTGQTNTSRFGMTGAEDLGGGYKAIFTLENGFDLSTGKLGQGGRLFGRSAFVGIVAPFGTITAGRQYEPLSQYVGALSSAIRWAGWTGAHPGDVDNMQSTIRFDNSVQYASPVVSGLSFKAMYAPGGVAGDLASERAMSFGAGYKIGSLTLGAGYLNINDPSIPAYGGTTLPNQPGYTTPVTSPIYRGFASAQTLQIIAVGGIYQIGAIDLGAIYSNTRFKNVAFTPTTPHHGGTPQFNDIEANILYRIVPAWQLGGAFIYSRTGTAQYLQWNAGVDYALSRRTDINLVTVWQRAIGIDSTGAPAVASIASLTPSTTSSQVAIRVNLRHRF